MNDGMEVAFKFHAALLDGDEEAVCEMIRTNEVIRKEANLHLRRTIGRSALRQLKADDDHGLREQAAVAPD